MPFLSNISSKAGKTGLISGLASLFGLSRTASWPANMSWLSLPSLAADTSAEAILTAFAGMEPDMVLDHLQTHKDGLTDEEADARRSIKGPNVLPTHTAPSWFITLLKAIPNPFNILLIALAIINAAIPPGDWKGFTVLIVMVVISVAVRFWQEYRSSLAVFKLQASVSCNLDVRRQPNMSLSQKVSTPSSEASSKTVAEQDLVPGDVVVLSPGSVMPADCLILEANFLRVSQSTWTGENDPVPKNPSVSGEKGTTLFDLSNIAFMGTSVISGNGVALVLRTGADVLIASMAKELKKRREPNSFQLGIRHVSYMLIGFMLTMVPLVLGISGYTTKDWDAAALYSISVAVGLVPEMLPAIVNANLARGAYVLSKMKAISKRLDSVQNLGAMTVLCSDKTGTLTKDEITLCQYLDGNGETNVNVLKLATVDALVQGSNGNNIDGAILDYRMPDGCRVNTAQYEKVAAIPFNFERRRSACVVKGITGANLLICKGAFEEVLRVCSMVRQGGVALPLDFQIKQTLLDRANSLNKEGYRVLLVAMKQIGDISREDEDGLHELESSMILEGMISFIDPPKEDAAESIAQLKSLGIEVKVLTGDTLPVAVNVCQRLDLISRDEGSEDDDLQAITGPELSLLEDTDEFDNVVKTCKVFAKLTPNQKALVIGSLRKAGHCVGMLGDGINDCIALRKADVGISVDSGASVAKDCADLILTEKGLGIIVTSVTTGRLTHGNTIKYIKMVASSNFGNVFSMLAASAWLPFTPMLGIQILAQNLLYDISQIAIPWDRVDPEYLATPKTWKTWDLLRFVVVLGPTSSVIDILTFSLGWFFYGIQTTEDPVSVMRFQTHWFLQGLLTQTLIVHLLRTAKIPFIQSRAAKPLALSTTAIMIIGFVLPWIPPVQRGLSFEQPAPSYVGFLVAELLLYCIEVQIVKMIYIKIFKTWL
ncbi:magnesium-translocating P-type ATPase family protein [Metarhizium acridum CQMa 102]|uniref:Magnesium-transporting ATPase, P-type 1 n=1 Tax=Metarhizium acridum (strain CQMa 102) TaxID=655827 RepID=E9E3D0_METAQ|nr:magnesium-translocating P-type ATPase family protein [Metarhizium acridum CQMa 102]EFY89523.1 magnesium-translocating P-type ATPase family protein [Metarhizium acridum CQMa 102]